MNRFRPVALLVAGALCALAPPAAAQEAGGGPLAQADTVVAPQDDRPRGLVTREELIEHRLRRMGIDDPDPAPTRPTSRADSLAWERHRRAALESTGRRIVVSLFDRRLWLIDGRDTLLSAPAGVGMGVVRGRDFSTPRGRRVVLGKEENPLWVPPDWHYYGQAERVRRFPAGGIRLADGSRVVRRGDRVGILRDGAFEPIPPERPLDFEGTLYIPPFGTVNRQIPYVLGDYKLDTGDAILIHGTNDPLAVGFWATHGCVRLFEDDIEFLYENTPVGTAVYIY